MLAGVFAELPFLESRLVLGLTSFTISNLPLECQKRRETAQRWAQCKPIRVKPPLDEFATNPAKGVAQSCQGVLTWRRSRVSSPWWI